MTAAQYESAFRKKALVAGYSEENIQKCLSYAIPLLSKGFPIIYNTTNFAGLVGYNKLYLKKAALFTASYYRTFKVKKKKKKDYREIKEPLPSLKEIQLWILYNILYQERPSKYAKAYIQKRNLRENVKFHVGKNKVLNLDFKHFFPSIKQDAIEKIFLSFGYSSNISNLLSKLCCLDGSLPQGAPTSPYLSNLYLKTFDEDVFGFCKNKHIRYTRYADDMTFSGDFNELEVINFIKEKIEDSPLEINDEKTRVMRRNQRQVVTGILVNDKTQVSKKYRNNIRLEMYYISKYGIAEHLAKSKNSRANYLSHLLGKIEYTLHFNPDDVEFLEYRSKLKQLLPKKQDAE